MLKSLCFLSLESLIINFWHDCVVSLVHTYHRLLLLCGLLLVLLHWLHGHRLHGLHLHGLHGLHGLPGLHELLIDLREHRLLRLVHTHLVFTSEDCHWHGLCTHSAWLSIRVAWHHWLHLHGLHGLNLVISLLHHHLRHACLRACLRTWLIHRLTIIIGVIFSRRLLLLHLHGL